MEKRVRCRLVGCLKMSPPRRVVNARTKTAQASSAACPALSRRAPRGPRRAQPPRGALAAQDGMDASGSSPQIGERVNFS